MSEDYQAPSGAEHPITPPPELVEQWRNEEPYEGLLSRAAQYGADQELEACCEYLVRCAQWEPEDVAELRTARRPKPPSLKEQALKALNSASFQPGTDFRQIDPARSAIIRRALEQLPE
jgi:hypothetical protein